MTSHVVATAGHVDHGKSTLVRALTGMEPDRWAEERRRGLTIDLGFAWTSLPNGDPVTFVDVPGHGRFMGNALAGLGAAGVVCFVVAADEGWSAQSAQHRDAVAALGIRHGVVVITKADRAPERVSGTIDQARDELARTGLRHAPVIVVSSVQLTGLDAFRAALTDVLAHVERPRTHGRVRMWVDRAFNVAGSGTVITGTLTAGTLSKGDRVHVLAPGRVPRRVTIRGIQSRGIECTEVRAVDRVALNLRGISATDVARGDVVVTPGAWHVTSSVDVRRTSGDRLTEAPRELRVHLGAASVRARVRTLGEGHARLALEHPLPISLGDQMLLHDPGSGRVFAGVQVLDPDPPALQRRGDGLRRAATLTRMQTGGGVADAVVRHGAIRMQSLRRLGHTWGDDPEGMCDGVRQIGEWLVSVPVYEDWTRRLEAAVKLFHERDPLARGLPVATARNELGALGATFLDELIVDAHVERVADVLRPAGSPDSMGHHETGVAELEHRLEGSPFAAPDAGELACLGLGPHQLAAAERLGRLLRLDAGVVVLPTTPAQAVRVLARLPQPFTTSAARHALGASRRVVIALLEHLDSLGRTRRVDDRHRVVVDE